MPSAATVTDVPATGLRLLLFGLPGSGKSSLLGALAQAGATQDDLLKGRLTDASGMLANLRTSTYGDKAIPDTPGIVQYSLRYEPQDDEPLTATLLDCNGQDAEQFLNGKRALTDRDALASALLQADTVILLLDASAAGEALAKELGRLEAFLDLLAEVRGRRADVAELPVYLVLTKCDRLAKSGDTLGHWMARVEEAKRKLAERLHDYLDDEETPPAFGGVDLRVWATAIKRPSAQEEPYGVAELFRQCLESADEFRGRRQGAGSRLGLAFLGLAGLVGFCGILAAIFVASQPDADLVRLQDQIRLALPDPASPTAERLRGPLEPRLAQLHSIEHDASFGRLSQRQRDDIARAGEETVSYLKANQELQNVAKKPYQAKDEAEFVQFEKQVAAFQMPPGHAEDWAETRLAQRLQQVRQEYASVRLALLAEEAWIRARIKEGESLLRQGERLYAKLLEGTKLSRSEPEKWFIAINDHMRPQFRLPREERIPGVSALTFDDLSKFEALKRARKDWDNVKEELSKIHNLVESRLKKAG